jgi:hypothetical protein
MRNHDPSGAAISFRQPMTSGSEASQVKRVDDAFPGDVRVEAAERLHLRPGANRPGNHGIRALVHSGSVSRLDARENGPRTRDLMPSGPLSSPSRAPRLGV